MAQSIKEIEFEKGECWWGGTTIHAYCPITEKSYYNQDFRVHCPNQTMPLFISNKGRYIWSDLPFAVEIEDGKFKIEGGNIKLVKAGNTLKEAYKAAQKSHFPSDKKELEKIFFTVPQYNSWIEFTYYPTQEGILKYARDILKNGFEAGILIIDEGWHTHEGYGNWEFDFGRFPNPKKMVEELHALGFYVMLWMTPFVTPVGPKYVRSLKDYVGTDPESTSHIYCRTTQGEVAITRWWNGQSAILDFTDKYNCEYLDSQLMHLMNDYGIDGFKFDGGAVEHYSDNNVINGEFEKSHTPHEINIAWNKFGSRFDFHEYKDTYKGGGKNTIQRLHDRDHSWTYNGINEIIPCAVTAGLIGHPFICPDMIGGGEWRNRYTKGFKTDEELFVRMAQCSALFPMMQFSWAPWEALSTENLKYCIEAAKLHLSMQDEIIELVKKSEKSGEPIIRNLEYNYPNANLELITDEYMLGEDILVAPVIKKGQYEREVVFPKGKWRAENGDIYIGPKAEILPSPLGALLWFRKV